MVMSDAFGLFLTGFSVCFLNRKSDRTVPFSTGKLTYENFMVDFSFFSKTFSVDIINIYSIFFGLYPPDLCVCVT